jgi:hypothetical protein
MLLCALLLAGGVLQRFDGSPAQLFAAVGQLDHGRPCYRARRWLTRWMPCRWAWGSAWACWGCRIC